MLYSLETPASFTVSLFVSIYWINVKIDFKQLSDYSYCFLRVSGQPIKTPIQTGNQGRIHDDHDGDADDDTGDDDDDEEDDDDRFTASESVSLADPRYQKSTRHEQGVKNTINVPN